MKKALYTLFAVILVIPMTASAATFSFTPNTGAFTPNEVINIAVYINPGVGEEITTAKLSASFPADMLEVTSFSQESGWMALAQPGYDLTDNTAGILVKTGGFPAKITSTKLFGTITFRAKIAGTATITVMEDSLLLDPVNTDKKTSSNAVSFTIATATQTPVVTPETSDTQVVTVDTPEPTTPSETGLQEDEESTTDETATTTLETQLAAVGASEIGEEVGFNMSWYYLLTIVLLAVGFMAWNKWGRKEDTV